MNHSAKNTSSARAAMRELIAAMPIVILANALRAALQRASQPSRATLQSAVR